MHSISLSVGSSHCPIKHFHNRYGSMQGGRSQVHLLCNQRTSLHHLKVKACSRYTSLPPSTWNSHFMKSLHSPFSASLFGDRVETLVRDIQIDVNNTFRDSSDENGFMMRLSFLESVDFLGIDRYFNKEIKEALDYVVRQWSKSEGTSEKSSYTDLQCTSISFRLLRLHRYKDIVPDRFARFKNVNGGFHGIEMDVEGKYNTKAIKTAISLLRASHVQFPGETILEEAENFVAKLLNALMNSEPFMTNSDLDYLIKQVQYVLKYQWYNSSPRWESRCFIDFYGEDIEWLKCNTNKNILELAKIDYNIIQAIQQEEIKDFTRWWNESEVSKLDSIRNRPVVSYFSIAIGIFEPEFRSARICVSKATIAHYVLDDTYDSDATLEEVNLMTKALQKWDASSLHSTRESIKLCFLFVLDTFSELSRESTEKHDMDMGAHMRVPTQQLGKTYQTYAQWIASRKVPSLEEFLKNTEEKSSIWPLVETGQVFMCDSLWIKWRKEGPKVSTLLKVCSRAMRLLDDLMDYEDEDLSVVHCFQNENPTSSHDMVILSLQQMLKECMKQIAKLYLAPEHDDEEEPLLMKRVVFEVTRAAYLLASNGDCYTEESQNFKHLVSSVFFNPVPFT